MSHIQIILGYHVHLRRYLGYTLNVYYYRQSDPCLKESDWTKGILASDSTGVETDRYDYEVRLVSKRKFEKSTGKNSI